MAFTDINSEDRLVQASFAEAIEQADLNADQEALLENLLGKDYEVITAGDRLEKIATDFVEHAATRWESGKSMMVCIDKIAGIDCVDGSMDAETANAGGG